MKLICSYRRHLKQHSRQSLDVSDYECELTSTAYGGRAFSHGPLDDKSRGPRFSSAVPAIWNSLPTSVIEASSLPVFRRRLKTPLFTVAFEASG